VCDGPEGREDSFGKKRKRREVNEQDEDINVREMFRVYETREEMVAAEASGSTVNSMGAQGGHKLTRVEAAASSNGDSLNADDTVCLTRYKSVYWHIFL